MIRTVGFARPLTPLGARLAAAMLAFVAVGCSNLSQVETRPAEPGFVAEDIPELRPADFTARFSQDGGMAPWSERLEIDAEQAEYSVWMSDVTYVFGYTPTESQLDGLYANVRLGRFGEYLVVPFKEGEEVYDGGTTFYAVNIGDVSHRIGLSDEDLVVPDSGLGPEASPLVALRSFVDLSATPAAAERLTIRYDEAITELYLDDLEVRFDFGDSIFAMGDERWAEEFEIGWSGGAREISVSVSVSTASGSTDEERSTLVEQTLPVASGDVVELVRSPDDGIELRLSPLS